MLERQQASWSLNVNQYLEELKDRKVWTYLQRMSKPPKIVYPLHFEAEPRDCRVQRYYKDTVETTDRILKCLEGMKTDQLRTFMQVVPEYFPSSYE